MKLFLLCFSCLLIFGCNKATISSVSNTPLKDIKQIEKPSFQFNYTINEPDQIHELPEILKEISGLSFGPDKSLLYAVQDENGILFGLDKQTAKIVFEKKFYKNGDYEGIEFVDDKIYVVKSTGTIYQFSNNFPNESSSDTIVITKHKKYLHKRNDVEGLGLDKANHRLLMACKDKACFKPENEEFFKLKRAIFSFNLKTNSIDSLPAFVIDLKDVKQYLEDNPKSDLEERLDYAKFFKENPEAMPFCPSAIAVHPINGHIFLLSSVGKMMMIINQAGDIVYIQKLKKKIHPQPEGLVFDEDGTMYISNEAKKGQARLVVYQYKP